MRPQLLDPLEHVAVVAASVAAQVEHDGSRLAVLARVGHEAAERLRIVGEAGEPDDGGVTHAAPRIGGLGARIDQRRAVDGVGDGLVAQALQLRESIDAAHRDGADLRDPAAGSEAIDRHGGLGDRACHGFRGVERVDGSAVFPGRERRVAVMCAGSVDAHPQVLFGIPGEQVAKDRCERVACLDRGVAIGDALDATCVPFEQLVEPSTTAKPVGPRIGVLEQAREAAQVGGDRMAV